MTTRAARRVANAPHSGYQRVEAGDMLLLMDTGRAAAARRQPGGACRLPVVRAVARLQRIVVNCGLPATNRETWRQVARATAAHSTVVFNDTSSCRFLEGGSFKRLLGTPIVGGPTDVPVAREERDDAHRAARLARRLRRPLQRHPSARADAVAGRQPARRRGPVRADRRRHACPPDVPDEFAVRFHLHPSVKANRLTDGHGAMLMLPNRDVWTFNAYEDRVELEESVYLAGSDGPRRAVQIVIYGRARKVPRVHWTFAHAPPAGRRQRAAAAARNRELPL